MKYNNILTLIIVAIWMLAAQQVRAVVVGSNTAVSRQAVTLFPAADSDNEMRGFAFFDKGFTLETSATSCTYNSLFPLGGDITLNGGTLSLNRDCILLDSANIKNAGIFNGNNYALRLTTTNTVTLPSGTAGYTTTSSVLSLINEVTATVNAVSVDWSYDSAYVAGAFSVAASFDELRVYGFNGSTLTLLASLDMGVSALSVRWHPSKQWLAVGISQSASTEVRIYSFSSNTLTLIGSFETGRNAAAVAWHPTGNYLAVTSWFSSSSVTDSLTVFSVAGNGALAQVANVNFGTAATFTPKGLHWHPSGNRLAMGMQSHGSYAELRVYSFNGSALTLNGSKELGQHVQTVHWHPTLNCLAVGLSGTTQRIRIYTHDSAAGTLTDQTGAYVGEGTAAVLSLQWNPAGTELAMGRTTNATGTELRVYSFNSLTYALTLQQGLDFSGSVNDVSWSKDNQYIATATNLFKIGIYRRILYTYNAVGPYVTFSDIALMLSADVSLLQSLKFQGLCKIVGQGHVLDLQDTYSLVLDEGATLLLQDLKIKGITADNIYCVDSAGTFTLNNVVWLQDTSYSFTQGRFDITGNVIMNGSSSFIYQSAQPSTIDSQATWQFNPGMTLSYAPSIASRNLLTMKDSTSTLHLYETSLQSTTTGLQLTKGTLKLQGTCPVISAATVQSEGIMLGDGVSSGNSVTVKTLPESGLNITSGWFVNNNI